MNERTSIDFSEEQLLNIAYMFVTFCVLNELRSSIVSEEHSLNMDSIFVTPVVLRFSSPLMLVIADKQLMTLTLIPPKNIPFIEVKGAFFIEGSMTALSTLSW